MTEARGATMEGATLPSGEPCDCCEPGCICADCPDCMGEEPNPARPSPHIDD